MFFSKLRSVFQIVFRILSQCFIKFFYYIFLFFYPYFIFLLSTCLFLFNLHASFLKNFWSRFFGLAIALWCANMFFFACSSGITTLAIGHPLLISHGGLSSFPQSSSNQLSIWKVEHLLHLSLSLYFFWIVIYSYWWHKFQ